MRAAYFWSGFWILSALVFNVLVYFWKGEQAALEFFTGYLIEKSLSVDNLFIFYLIFKHFNLNIADQHKALNWGIIGALIMRAIFIYLGIVLLKQYHWVIYLMGFFLVLTGLKMAFEKPERQVFAIPNFFSKILPKIPKLIGAIVVVEFTDLVFALDSIPAILAITQDPFIVYTSNIFAILGLRSLYFVLAHVLGRFHYLQYGLSIILIFVGCKMLIADFYQIPTLISLAVIVLILSVTLFWGFVKPVKKP